MSIPLELLAPARNLECGIAAIEHGADAVYIGAERFGARAAAGNSVDDIAELCRFAHVYEAKVYVTVNTIIYDDELNGTQELINRLHSAGVDAILVQDMGILSMNLPGIALHASTQTDNRTVEKVAWLASHGFGRVVLARELSLDEIAAIHRAVPGIELEAFVHGALCVSYSGQCYASQYCFGRSANRGECAQFCRLKFNLEDADGRVIERGRHLLSLKDMCRIDNLEQMADAGVTSFKIEGRLKDVTYVKNVTAAYSLRLNEIISRSNGRYRRASLGRCRYSFTPCLEKTFNRGFTDYFINGHRGKMASPDTPKATGEHVGHVKEIRGGSFTVAGTASFANGDGLCFMDDNRNLVGFRVNRADGNRIFPFKMPSELKRGTELYRNGDRAFEKLLSHKSAERKIPVVMRLEAVAGGFRLEASVSGAAVASVTAEAEIQEAVRPQRENIEKQLAKLGNTPFECTGVELRPSDFNFFIPSSRLADMRRKVTEQLAGELSASHGNNGCTPAPRHCRQICGMPQDEHAAGSWLLNVSNHLARHLYEDEGMTAVDDAFELRQPDELLLMQCRYCLRYALGHCVKRGGSRPSWHEPLFLCLPDGRRFRLQFDCVKCGMNVYAVK